MSNAIPRRRRPPLLRIVRSVCIGVVAVAVFAIFELNLIPTTKRGFFCDDQRLRYPYARSTVPDWLLIILYVVLPDVGMACVELRRRRYAKTKKSFVDLLYTLGHFQLGLGANGILTDSIKCLVGRLRPHFVAVCAPDVLVNLTCDAATAMKYFRDYECLNELGFSERTLEDAHKSFPSGKKIFVFF